MRFGKPALAGAASLLVALSASAAGDLTAVHLQRYAMGTMFDIVAYHPTRAEAQAAAESAFDEILRLDALMSDYKPESALSRLNRQARSAAVEVDATLYEVIRQAVTVSRMSAGKFDITIAPVLKVWRTARSQQRRPSARELEAARRCVGSEHLELMPPNRIRFRSDCLELDLGGIGKGYAVDRAMAVLQKAGIRHATINAGGSSIAAIGAPPGRTGWPILLGPLASGRHVLTLHDTSISTSEQDAASGLGDIIDPRRGAPAAGGMAVSVVSRSATLADALSTTLSIVAMNETMPLLDRFPEVSVVWVSSAGEVRDVHRPSRLDLAPLRP